MADADLVLIDGSSYLYRAFHALPNLNNSAGTLTMYRESADFLSAVAAVSNMRRVLTGLDRPEEVELLAVSHEFFDVFLDLEMQRFTLIDLAGRLAVERVREDAANHVHRLSSFPLAEQLAEHRAVVVGLAVQVVSAAEAREEQGPGRSRQQVASQTRASRGVDHGVVGARQLQRLDRALEVVAERGLRRTGVDGGPCPIDDVQIEFVAARPHHHPPGISIARGVEGQYGALAAELTKMGVNAMGYHRAASRADVREDVVRQIAEERGADAILFVTGSLVSAEREVTDSRTDVQAQVKGGGLVDFFRYDYEEAKTPAKTTRRRPSRRSPSPRASRSAPAAGC